MRKHRLRIKQERVEREQQLLAEFAAKSDRATHRGFDPPAKQWTSRLKQQMALYEVLATRNTTPHLR